MAIQGSFPTFELMQARLIQEAAADAAQAAELKRLIDLKEVETKLLQDKYQMQIQANQTLHSIKIQLGRDQQNIQYALDIIEDKTANYERRHCEQSYEMPGAARNLQVFCQATGRGCLSKQHLQVFADWIEMGEVPEDFNYGKINMMKDENRAKYQASVVLVQAQPGFID